MGINQNCLSYHRQNIIAGIESPAKLVVGIYGEEVVSSSSIDHGLAPVAMKRPTHGPYYMLSMNGRRFRKLWSRRLILDVIVLAVSLFAHLNVSQLCIKFFVGNSSCFIPAHNVASIIRESESF